MDETSTSPSLPVARLLDRGAAIASGVPEGLDAAVLGTLARHLASEAAGNAGKPILHIARDGQRLATLEDALAFFAPEVKRLSFPAWDGVPYDRVAPNAEIIASRVATLAELAEHRGGDDETPLIVLTTVNAVLQRVPSHEIFAARCSLLLRETRSAWPICRAAGACGYGRAGTVIEPGQYAVRGGILDFYPPGASPVRLDFFGDTLESIRAFDPETQRTLARLDAITLLPMSEAPLTEAARNDSAHAMWSCSVRCGATTRYMSRSRPAANIRAWNTGCLCSMSALRLCSTICRTPSSPSSARRRRARQAAGAGQRTLRGSRAGARAQGFRRAALQSRAAGKPVPHRRASGRRRCAGGTRSARSVRASRRRARRQCGVLRRETRAILRRRAPARRRQRVRRRGRSCRHAPRRRQARARRLLEQRRQGAPRHPPRRARHRRTLRVDTGKKIWRRRRRRRFAVLPLETGFEAPDVAVIGEQDILGDRLVRPHAAPRAARRAHRSVESRPATSSSTPSTASAASRPHAPRGRRRAARLPRGEYQGGDKLYLPVENIEMLSALRLGRVGRAARQARRRRPGSRARRG